MTTRQLNLRVPDEARDVLTKLATRLREKPELATRLETWLDGLEDPTRHTLAERVAVIEARLGISDTPDSTPQDTPLTMGEGKGQRLTTAGRMEVERRVEAGEDDGTISEAVGVSVNTVRAHRKTMSERLL